MPITVQRDAKLT